MLPSSPPSLEHVCQSKVSMRCWAPFSHPKKQFQHIHPKMFGNHSFLKDTSNATTTCCANIIRILLMKHLKWYSVDFNVCQCHILRQRMAVANCGTPSRDASSFWQIPSTIGWNQLELQHFLEKGQSRSRKLETWFSSDLWRSMRGFQLQRLLNSKEEKTGKNDDVLLVNWQKKDDKNHEKESTLL